MPLLRYIGWNIAITKKGLYIIEANNSTDVDLLQVHKPLLINEKVRNFYIYHEII